MPGSSLLAKKVCGNSILSMSGQVSRQFADTPVRELVFGVWSLTHGFASLAIVRRLKVKRTLLDSWARQVFAPYIRGLAR